MDNRILLKLRAQPNESLIILIFMDFSRVISQYKMIDNQTKTIHLKSSVNPRTTPQSQAKVRRRQNEHGSPDWQVQQGLQKLQCYQVGKSTVKVEMER